MGEQAVRQAARRSSVEARAGRVARRRALGAAVAAALAERDAAVAGCEARAGALLATLTVGEGLSLRDAVGVCGGGLSVSEAGRLRRLATAGGEAGAPAGGGR